MNSNNNELYVWCLEQAAARYMGLLSQEQISKLDAVGFPWERYETALTELGFDWKMNKPNKRKQ